MSTCQGLSQCVNALGRHDRRCPAAPMTAVDVDALNKLRANDVTPGAWTVRFDHKEDDHPDWDQVWIEAAGATVATLGERYTSAPRDAALIVAAVNALPALLAAVRRGRALREAVEDISEDMEINAEEVGRGEGELNEGDLERYATRLRAVVAAVDGGEQ